MIIACPECGTLQDAAPLAASAVLIWSNCGDHLGHGGGRSNRGLP